MKIEKLSPAFKDYLWGGTKLRDVYGKKCDYEKVAESWELSTHPAGQSVIDGGEYYGLKFGEYLEKVGAKALGVNGAKFKEFPVLIKFIDAKQPLSVQVHPSDEYALRVEGEYGKTEMWYVVDCEPGASLYFGVNRALTKEEFKKRIEDRCALQGRREEGRRVLHSVRYDPRDRRGNSHLRNSAEFQHDIPRVRLRPPRCGRQAA